MNVLTDKNGLTKVIKLGFLNRILSLYKIKDQENSDKKLMLLLILFLVPLADIYFFTKLALYAEFGISFFLSGFILIFFSSLLIFLKYKPSFYTIIAHFVCVFIAAAQTYTIFNTGRIGFTYVWFYLIPIISFSILKKECASIYSILFALNLTICFYFVPSYYIDVDYTSQLKLQLLLSYTGLLIVVLIKEWGIEIYKENTSKIEKEYINSLFFKKKAIEKLSGHISFSVEHSKKILQNIDTFNLEQHSVESIKRLYTALDTIDSVSESAKEYLILDPNIEIPLNHYSIYHAVNRTIQLFNTHNVNIKIKIDKELPAFIFGKEILVKLIIYNLISFLVKDDSKLEKQILISITKNKDHKDYIRLSYQITEIINPKFSFNEVLEVTKRLPDKELNESIPVLVKSGLGFVVAMTESLKGKAIFHECDDYKTLGFSYKVKKDKNYRPLNIYNTEHVSSIINSKPPLFSSIDEKINLLIISDNPMEQNNLKLTFSRITQTMDFAKNYKEALNLFINNSYDIIFIDLDYSLSEIKKIVKKIRNLESGINTRTFIMGLYSEKIQIPNFSETNIDDYVEKPVSVDTIKTKISNFITKNKSIIK